MRASACNAPSDCRVSEALRRKTPRNDACWACLPGRFHFSLVNTFIAIESASDRTENREWIQLRRK